MISFLIIGDLVILGVFGFVVLEFKSDIYDASSDESFWIKDADYSFFDFGGGMVDRVVKTLSS